MALAIRALFEARDQAIVTMTYDDTTGAIQTIQGTVASGTLKVTIHRVGQNDIVRFFTNDFSFNVPAGYNLTPYPKDNSWVWAGPIGADFDWVAPAASAAAKKV